MSAITADDAQEWLEHHADRWLDNPQLTPSLLVGVTEAGWRPIWDPELGKRSLRDALYGPAPVIRGYRFYAKWFGMELTTVRMVP